ncbi:pentapeptide repeat-containing protein [Prochlorothrix hollandica]
MPFKADFSRADFSKADFSKADFCWRIDPICRSGDSPSHYPTILLGRS